MDASVVVVPSVARRWASFGWLDMVKLLLTVCLGGKRHFVASYPCDHLTFQLKLLIINTKF